MRVSVSRPCSASTSRRASASPLPCPSQRSACGENSSTGPDHVVGVRDEEGRDEDVALRPRQHVPVQGAGQDARVVPGDGAGHPVAAQLVDGHGVVVVLEFELEVVGVDGGAVVHVPVHVDRDVAGDAPEVPALVLQDVLEHRHAQRDG